MAVLELGGIALSLVRFVEVRVDVGLVSVVDVVPSVRGLEALVVETCGHVFAEIP